MNFRIFTTVFLLSYTFHALAAVPISGRFETSFDEQYLTYNRSIKNFPDIDLKRDSSYQISISTLNSSVDRLKVYLCNETLDSCENLVNSGVKMLGSILSKKTIYCTVPLDKLNIGTHSFSFQISIVEVAP